MIDKLDIIMWTKNGEPYLTDVLARIDRVIPSGKVHRRILVDDHSEDRTTEIAKHYGWTVYPNPAKGIPSGANEALRHVDCDFFISIEQDVILALDWWEKISRHFDDPLVGCAQGIRIPSHPILNLLDQWEHIEQGKPRMLMNSFDNNIFRTQVVQSLGGFPNVCPACSDTILRKIMLEKTRFKWIIDNDVVSSHVRSKINDYIDHGYKMFLMCARTPYCVDYEASPYAALIRRLITSPIRGFQIALKKKYPAVAYMYPYLRLYSLISVLKWKPERFQDKENLNSSHFFSRNH